MLHEISVSNPVLAAPSGYNFCLRVGGLDVKIDFVSKFDTIGLVGVSFLQVFLYCNKHPCIAIGWLRTLVFGDH